MSSAALVAGNPGTERRRPLATRIVGLAILVLVGGCAHAGDDGAASATAEGGGGAPSLVSTGAPGGSGGPAIDEDSASPQGGSSVVEDSATTDDASSGGPTSDRPPGGSAGATGSGDAASSTPVIPIDAAGVTNVPDAMVVTGGGDQSSLACPQTCTNGCCDGAGSCLEGTVDDACGGRGSTCQDCSAAGQTCQAGICTAPPAPSTPPPPPPSPGPSEPACSAASCSNPCVPYFVRCCKSDDTCGCALLFPRGPCN